MPTVFVVGGPAGTGKTTTGTMLAFKLHCPYIEGDSLHPKANIEKMSEGIPLTDDDRWGWLKRLSEIASKKASEDSTGCAVVSCSMLKRSYRKYIKECSSCPCSFRFIFLYTSYEELIKRVSHRHGHYMKSDMVKSQYDIMEIPSNKELIANGGDAVAVNATNQLPEEVFEDVLGLLDL
ncbi:uncharacterized protein PRCAT00004545001 [Priceomyces carsonii]|uniref:uncharacterized protein n=1 Tax=Priceomyces carsonii TaxID=28549 RepID=UPI002EDBAD23|nr:unnamed protein product [Priceomyces carsonii]